MSNLRKFLEYVIIMFISYLLINFIIYLIDGQDIYRNYLKSTYNIHLFFFVYWWIPLFRIADMDNNN